MLIYKGSIDDEAREIKSISSIFYISIFETYYIMTKIIYLFNCSNSIAIMID